MASISTVSTVSSTAGRRCGFVYGSCAKRSGSRVCEAGVCSCAGAQHTQESRCTSKGTLEPDGQNDPNWAFWSSKWTWSCHIRLFLGVELGYQQLQAVSRLYGLSNACSSTWIAPSGAERQHFSWLTFPCSVFRPTERQRAPVVDSADPDLRSRGYGLTVGRSAAQLTLAQSLPRPRAFDGAV